MLAGVFFATAVHHPAPRYKRRQRPFWAKRDWTRSYTVGYTKIGSGYTTGYTNDPQKGCIRLNSVEHACLNATQNETAIIQWIKVKVKKVMVGMERFELSTS